MFGGHSMTAIQDQTEFDGWHRGEMKKYGVILFKLKLPGNHALISRYLSKPVNGFECANFVEDRAVTKGLIGWGLDIDITKTDSGKGTNHE